jgi:hypothetical protein
VTDPTPKSRKQISEEYRRWWRKLTTEERKKLIASGCFEVSELHNAEAALSRTIAEDTPINFLQADSNERGNWLSRLVSNHSKDSVVDEVQANEEHKLQDNPALLQSLALIRLRATLHFLLDVLDGSSDPAMRLHADIIRIVIGEGNPRRMTDIAKSHGLTKSAISLRCRTLLRRLGLEPSKFMRPEDEVNSIKVAAIVRSINKVDTEKKSVRKKFSKRIDPGKESFRDSHILPKAVRPSLKSDKKTQNPQGPKEYQPKPRKH